MRKNTYNYDNFIRQIRRRMVAINISQRELAKLSGLSEVSISRYLSGTRIPDYHSIVSIANALECDPGYLFGTDKYYK